MAAEVGLNFWHIATMVIGVTTAGGVGRLFNLAANQRANDQWRKTVEARLKDSTKMRDAVIAMQVKVGHIEASIGEIKDGQKQLIARIADCPKLTIKE